jgi:serine/threonine-protein kinase
VAQVFVSYKSEDRGRLRPLVKALEAEGLQVWWDARLEGGAAWREAIEQQLDAADCVVVAWSERSIAPEGRFVRDEADRALGRGVYLPVLLDNVRPPLGFAEVQALPLTGWRGDPADGRFQAVLEAVRRKVQGGSSVAAHPRLAKPALGRRTLIVGGVATSLAIAGASGWMLWGRIGEAADKRSIAVLPFANLSGDPGQAYFADGLAEELRSALIRIGELKVIARQSSEAVRKAARKLGVATVLTGSVRRSGTLLRVSTQLVDGRSGVEMWAQTYDRPAGDVLEIQTGIAQSVADALRIRLAPAQKAALTSGTAANAAAQDLYLKAQAVLHEGEREGDLRRALALLDGAISADPSYVAALATRSRSLYLTANLYESGDRFRRDLADSLATAQRAVALDPKSALAQSALAAALANNMDYVGALQRHRIAYRLAPGDPDVLIAYAQFSTGLGRTDEALMLTDEAIARDPLDARKFATRARVLTGAHRFAEALAAARKSLVLLPTHQTAHSQIGDALVLMGRPAEAAAEYQQVASDWDRLRGLAIARARMGDRPGSDRELTALQKLDDGLLNFQFAEVFAQRGEIDRGVEALESAWRAADSGLSQMPGDAMLEPLRADPRFQDLLKKLNFPS